jgi:hypothetical protein
LLRDLSELAISADFSSLLFITCCNDIALASMQIAKLKATVADKAANNLLLLN